eukprot:m.180781 g.180781  ORF g.180781 m.180781 type:complete len:179 (+) comp17434_c2_seq3:2316-2852(+)
MKSLFKKLSRKSIKGGKRDVRMSVDLSKSSDAGLSDTGSSFDASARDSVFQLTKAASSVSGASNDSASASAASPAPSAPVLASGTASASASASAAAAAAGNGGIQYAPAPNAATAGAATASNGSGAGSRHSSLSGLSRPVSPQKVAPDLSAAAAAAAQHTTHTYNTHKRPSPAAALLV